MRDRYQLITAAENYPMSLDDAKDHLRYEDTEDDALIQDYLAAATEWAENYTRRKIATQTWDILLDDFPRGSEQRIILPFGKIQAVKSITYADTATTTVTLEGPTSDTPGTDFQESLGSDVAPILMPAYGSVWPSITKVLDAVKIRVVAGYGDIGDSPYPPIPEEIVNAIRVRLTDYYERRASDDVRNVALERAEGVIEPQVLPVW